MGDGFHRSHMTLTKAQVNKLRLGHPVQISAGALHQGRHHVYLHHAQHKKVEAARRAHRGVRIQMHPHEFEASMQGGGIKEFFENIGNKIKQAIKSPAAKKFIRGALHKLVDVGSTALSAYAPELAPGIVKYGQPGANKLVDIIGNETGAYGLRHRHGRGQPIYSPATPEYGPMVMPLPQFGGYLRFHPHPAGARHARGDGLNAHGEYVEGLPEIGNVGPLKGAHQRVRKAKGGEGVRRRRKAGSFLAQGLY